VLADGTGGDAVGNAVVVDGRGKVCFATHHCHKMRPTTQRATTIHAVRSINLHLPAAAIHKSEIHWRHGSENHAGEEPDRGHNRPTVDNAPGASTPTNCLAERRATRSPPENIANKSARTGNRSLARRGLKAA